MTWQTEFLLFLILLLVLFGRIMAARLLSSGKRPVLENKLGDGAFRQVKCRSGNNWAVEIRGQTGKPVIVLLHGLNSSSAEWQYQNSSLEKDHQLFLLDLPGHGRSGFPVELSIANLARDLKFVIEELQINTPVLYGHSMGGMVILEYMRVYGQRHQIKALVLQNTTYKDPYSTSSFAALFGLPRLNLGMRLLAFFRLVPGLSRIFSWVCYFTGISTVFYRYLYFTGRQSSQQLLFMVRLAVRTSPYTVAEALLKMKDFNASDILAKISVPVLIFGAERDRLTSVEASVMMHEEIKGSILKIVPEGHQSMIENPDTINETLNKFLDGLRS